MTNQTIVINGITLDIAEINNLLAQDRKVEAIKLVCEKAKIGLKDSKDIVDNVQAGNYDISNVVTISHKERVKTQKIDNEIIVTYFDTDGNESIVTPGDPLWDRVKTMTRNSETIQEYERNYSEQKKLQTAHATPVIAESKSYRILYIVIGIAVLIGLYYVYKW